MNNNLLNKNILVHTCCAPCMTYPFEKLIKDGYSPTAFFYNPNIHPVREYAKRLQELLLFTKAKQYQVMVQDSDTKSWFDEVKGFEQEKEGGKRCEICFRIRLEETAKVAKKEGFTLFTTTLSISPHKNATLINKIGKELEIKYGIEFLEANFKKQDGFKKSIEISKQYNLFRQDYCGCLFSQRK